jgi:hypothetical protein
MAFKKYTQCYVHTAGDEPFNEKDLGELAVVHGLVPAAFFGALTGLAAGLLVGGPIGAIVGLFVGIVSGVTVGLATALTEASQQWRFHRLVCLTGTKCAIGTVRKDPEIGDLGQFDNDEFFDLTLMPHHSSDLFTYAKPSDNYKTGDPGIVDESVQKQLDDHPKNDVYTDPDGCQGSELMRPIIPDLPYDTTHSRLHIEAEGDFWVRMAELAFWLGLLAGILAAATVAGGIGGGIAGAAIGCAIGAIFGGIGCIIGAILGAIIGAILGAAAVGAIGYLIIKAILDAIFETDPGDIEDANIGDRRLGPIGEGDKVALIGEHVYDGFHEGWHEIHPLMAIVKLGDPLMGKEAPFYLEWNPDFADSDPLPDDLPSMPSSPADDVTNLTPDDMRQGLNSDKFLRRALWLRDHWCGFLNEAFNPGIATNQQGLHERWTVHPRIDGCVPGAGPPVPH